MYLGPIYWIMDDSSLRLLEEEWRERMKEKERWCYMMTKWEFERHRAGIYKSLKLWEPLLAWLLSFSKFLHACGMMIMLFNAIDAQQLSRDSLIMLFDIKLHNNYTKNVSSDVFHSFWVWKSGKKTIISPQTTTSLDPSISEYLLEPNHTHLDFICDLPLITNALTNVGLMFSLPLWKPLDIYSRMWATHGRREKWVEYINFDERQNSEW